MKTPLSSSGLVLGFVFGFWLRFGGFEDSISCISITWLDTFISTSFILRGV